VNRADVMTLLDRICDERLRLAIHARDLTWSMQASDQEGEDVISDLENTLTDLIELLEGTGR